MASPWDKETEARSSVSAVAQDGSNASTITPPRDFSNLPEVSPYSTYPEVIGAPKVSEKLDTGVPIPIGVLPPPFSEVDTGPHQLEGDETTTVAGTMATRRVVWWRRKRNRCLVIALVVLVLLVVVGVAVGVGVPLSRGKSGDAQGISGGGGSGSSGDGQGTGVGSPGSGPGPGSDEPPTPLDFGTPITFPAEPGASVCSGTVCPQTLAVAEFGSPSNIFMFARGTDNAIRVREIRNSAWRTAEWKSLGGKFISQPAASSMRDGRVDVLGVWEDLSTRILTFQNGVWETEWTSLGGESSSPPSSCGLVRNQLNVIHVGPDNALYHKNATDGNTWGPSLAGKWDQLAGSVSSSLDVGCAAVSGSMQRFDIVAYGPAPEYAMFFKRWNTTGGWQDWVGGKGSYKGDPTVVSTPERVDYFGIGTDNAVWTTGWTASAGYSEPLSLGGSFQSAVSGIAIDAKSRLDILAVGNDTRLKHRGRSHGLWGTEWEDLGGSFNSAPKVVLLNSTSVGVFGVGLNGEMIHSTFTLGTGYYWGGEGQWYSDGGSMASAWHRQDPA